jgi:protoheme IX farnesyltransferase
MLVTRRLIPSTMIDYFNVAKPAGILPHLITATAAMFLATEGMPPLTKLANTLLGGAFLAAAANTYNSFFDRDLDAIMSRTRYRPLPSGRLKPAAVLTFGTYLGLIGVIVLSLCVNWITAALAVTALVYYVLVYTLWLKRRTFWSTVIGSGIGAIPPLIGWVAVTDHFSVTPFLLAAIVLLWTIPHFWGLASYRRDDYEQAGIHVLPKAHIGVWIIVCSILLVAVSFLLIPAASLNLLYLAAASVLGVVLFILVAWLNPDKKNKVKPLLYRFSVIYLTILFIAMIADKFVF